MEKYVYMIGIDPDYWTTDDDKACKPYKVDCKGYYELGIDEGFILVGTLKNLKKLLGDYFEVAIVDEYLTEYDYFDFEDGEWIIGGWNESKKSVRKSIKESKVDFQFVIDKVIPKEYAKNKNAYKYALSCVESLYNEDEYDSDSVKIYFLNCYISDSFPSWVDELGEEEMDALANALYDGTMKWSDIDSSWLE